MAAKITKPPWAIEAEKYLGLKEIAGAPTAPVIAGWLASLRAWWSNDEVPWCGTFAAHCMVACGVAPPKAWYRAKAWADWGQPLTAPMFGCIVVLVREGGGHVGLAVGRDRVGARLMVLGGNQGDAVGVSSFTTDRVVAYRWPNDRAMACAALPVGYAAPSTREA